MTSVLDVPDVKSEQLALLTAPAAKNFRGRLHGYQKNVVMWMLKRELTKEVIPRGGLLCMEMGLGKTVCTLFTMLANPKRTLIVVPLSLLHQWKTECELFLGITPNVVRVHRGSLRGYSEEAAIVLTTYSTFQTLSPYRKHPTAGGNPLTKARSFSTSSRRHLSRIESSACGG